MTSTSWLEDVLQDLENDVTNTGELVRYHDQFQDFFKNDKEGLIKHIEGKINSAAVFLLKNLEDLENDFTNAGEEVGFNEKKQKLLNDKSSMIYEEICLLLASLEPQDFALFDFFKNDKEVMIKHIEGKANSAASAITKMKQYKLPSEDRTSFEEDIVGIVAFLGTVKIVELSRILADYVGEDNMLAIVCKSSLIEHHLEKYWDLGKVNVDSLLYQIASAFGISVKGTFVFFSLEELSPFKGKTIRGDPQRKLDLPDPQLSTGYVPNGFLGYAVNFINLEANCVALRETLFYSLLGELQVYENKDCMIQASACIKNGAVSLDGGIIKRTNARSFGFWNPMIRFLVESLEALSNLSQETINILRELQQKKFDLQEVHVEMDRTMQVHSQLMEVFMKKKGMLSDQCAVIEAMIGNRNIVIKPC